MRILFGALRLSALTVWVASLFWVMPQRAFACSCANTQTVHQELDASSIVFAGEVTDIQMLPRPLIKIWPTDQMHVIFQVSRVWKGPLYEMFVLNEDTLCGSRFAAGETYLVFANESESGLGAALCGRTGLLNNHGETLAELGAGSAPTSPAPAPISPRGPDLTGAIVLVLVALLAIATFILWRLRRQPDQHQQVG